MRPIFSMTIALGLCLSGYSQPSRSPEEAADHTFLKNAAQGGMAEVQLGQLAEKNGSSEAVKQFGRRMVTDHTRMGDEVKSLAATKNVTLPATLNSKDQALYKSLSAKTGSDFDRAYITAMVKDHNHDIAAFQQEANSGSDPDIKSIAARALPTLQEHLRLAEDAAKQLGITTSTGPGLR